MTDKKEPLKITKKIIGYAVKKDTEELIEEDVVPETIGMHEGINRPQNLTGTTYKIKPMGKEHGLYLTINHIELEGKTYPYEVFINSIDMSSYQWIVALTRSLSAIWRKGGDFSFIIKEYEMVVQPDGGYWGKTIDGTKGKYFPSVVGEIGYILNHHFENLGLVERVLNIKEEQELKQAESIPEEELNEMEDTSELEPGTFRMDKRCPDCNGDVFRMADNCPTCVDCGASKCG